MVFLRSPFSPELPPVLKGEGELRVPEMADFESWAELRDESREFLMPWEPTWPQDDLTRTAFRLRIKRYMRDIEDDLAYPFFIHDIQSGSLLGGLTLVQRPPRGRADGLGRLLDRRPASPAGAI